MSVVQNLPVSLCLSHAIVRKSDSTMCEAVLAGALARASPAPSAPRLRRGRAAAPSTFGKKETWHSCWPLARRSWWPFKRNSAPLPLAFFTFTFLALISFKWPSVAPSEFLLSRHQWRRARIFFKWPSVAPSEFLLSRHQWRRVSFF